ncbi:MAG: Choline kinase [Chloroflexi bacterium]|nr:MAG: Choline kinase [Chloroflexota bacterium]
MKGVILSAGVGSRFGSYTEKEHKLLLTVGDFPIIDHTLWAFSQAGIVNVGLVTGFMSDRINDWVGDGSQYGLKIETIFNKNYRFGNALSVQMAQSFADGQDFILAMGDHMASSSLITNVMKFDGDYQGNVLGVDFNITSYHAQEATRVLVKDKETICSIGKHIKIWNGVDSGVFRFTSEIYEVINQWVNCDDSGRYELGEMLAYFIDQGGLLKSCDISGEFWHDIDNPEDLERLQTGSGHHN